MQADVPPDVRVVRDAAGLLELPDDLGVVGVVAEARRRARAGEGGEDHLPARGEAGRLAAPEGRARREREQRGEVREQPVHDLDRLLGLVDGDVDVQPEDQLAPRDVLELVDEMPVAVASSDALALEQRERVRPGRADAHALLGGDAGHVGAQLAQLVVDLGRRAADRRGDLEHGLHQLGVDARLELVALGRGEHGLDVLDEVERLAVEQHVLLLDAERVGLAGAEVVVEHAAALREARAGDRRREDLLHSGTNASSSISSSQRGSSSAATT